jgi:hypothetical protein
MFIAPSAKAIFDDAVKAHLGLATYRAKVSLDLGSRAARKIENLDINFDGKRLRYEIRQPKVNGLERVDRVFYFLPDSVVGYDVVANERMEQPTLKGKSLLQRVSAALGTPDDLVAYLLEPNATSNFLALVAREPGWKVSQGLKQGGLDKLELNSKSGQRSLTFYRGSHLLASLDAITKQNQIHWRFEYSKPELVRLKIPTNSRPVSSFSATPELPSFKSESARRVTKDLIGGYQSLRQGVIEVDSDDGHVLITFAGFKIREVHASFSYAYDGKVLSIRNLAKKSFYSGRIARELIPEAVSKVAGRVDPLARQFLSRTAPFKDIFWPGSTVSLSGEMLAEGTTCDILKVDFPGVRNSVFVRRDNHLVDSLSTDAVDANGRSLASSTRRFKYREFGVVKPISVFRLSPISSEKVLPLPKTQ